MLLLDIIFLSLLFLILIPGFVLDFSGEKYFRNPLKNEFKLSILINVGIFAVIAFIYCWLMNTIEIKTTFKNMSKN